MAPKSDAKTKTDTKAGVSDEPVRYRLTQKIYRKGVTYEAESFITVPASEVPGSTWRLAPLEAEATEAKPEQSTNRASDKEL